MPLLATFDIGSTLEQHCLIETITDIEIEIAMRKFNEMKENGVLSGEFSDDVWYIDNETRTTGINFQFNQIVIAKQKDTTYEQFVNDVKYYICLCFGKYTLLVFPRIINAIKHAVNDTNCFTTAPKDTKPLQLAGVADFLSLLPWVDEQYILPLIGYPYDLIRRRTLAEYQSYFLFDEIIKTFWKTATDEQKDFYYPLYFWWNISMVIPIRITEFSVIPKQCLSRKNGRWYITIRRTAIKGQTDVNKRYKLDTDYKKFTYEITDDIAESIMDYQRRTSAFAPAEIDSLFSDAMFVATKKHIIPGAKNVIIYPHMRVSHFLYILDCFYVYVIEGVYHYLICEKDTAASVEEDGRQYQLKSNEIVRLNLGDTRHIALQNLLLNGCNLLMAREISGHETIDMIFHYSGNMKSLIKCRAYNLYKLSQVDKDAKSAAVILSTDGINHADRVLRRRQQEISMEVDDGICHSPKFVQDHDASDCFSVGGNCSLCVYHEGKTDLSAICKQRERDFSEKCARTKIWMNSAKKLKDSEQIMIATENMATSAENLEMVYLKILQEGGKP